MNQITTCSFFKMAGFSNKLVGFHANAFESACLKKIAGLSFFKFLGSSAKTGFSAMPNFVTCLLLCVWKSEECASHFFSKNPLFKNYQKRSTEQFTVYLNSAESHGCWDGVKPFEKSKTLSLDKPVLVLTRASIRLKKTMFVLEQSRQSQSLERYKGLAFSIGVGEWPLIQQATISIWQTQAEMLDYAYKNQKHKEVVMLTRKLNWYKEEMFASFVPYKLKGFWDGKNVENWV